MNIEDEINEIEKYIKTLETNDDTLKEINKMIHDGMSKGLIYDFINTQSQYRGTMFSSQVIKKMNMMIFKLILINVKKKNMRNM